MELHLVFSYIMYHCDIEFLVGLTNIPLGLLLKDPIFDMQKRCFYQFSIPDKDYVWGSGYM